MRMSHCLNERLMPKLFVLALLASSCVQAQQEVPVQPAPDRLLEIPPLALATGIRIVTDGQLPFMELVRRGKTTFHFSELGQPVVVTLQNVGVWEAAFTKRLDLYNTAARRRGAIDIAGVYSILFEHSDCGAALPEDTQIRITQDGPSFTLVLKGKFHGVGTIVEDNVVLNLGNTVGEVPYWVGKAAPPNIAISDSGSKCKFSLTRH